MNAIAKECKVYEDLLNAFNDNKNNPVERFNKCYDVINTASYYEIHFIISMLKDFEGGDPSFNTNILGIVDLINAINSSGKSRRAFLLDMLEEARERKRPSNQ